MPLPPSAVRLLSELESSGIRLGLEAVRELLAALGDPHDRYPVVLVAGTNGKGSVAALLAAMASAAGYRTGLYTSPHLEDVEERMRIDGRAIAGGELAERLSAVVAAAERSGGPSPTYFEALTATAFDWFARRAVDLAVVEVGLGGRLDATNVSRPVLSLVTDVSLEHQELLGATPEAIAREKAGVLRAGLPALAWVEEPRAVRALGEAAAGLGARLAWAAQQVAVDRVEALGWEGQRVELVTPHARYRLETTLLGEHQVRNLGLAVRAAEELARDRWGRLESAAIAAGARRCRWPGRLEPVEVPGKRVLLDCAHNPGGAAALARFLAERRLRCDLLFGVLADKDAAAMLEPLAARAGQVVLTAPPSPRAAPPDALAALPSAGGAAVEPEPGQALDRALAGPAPLLVACGSIYLVGAVRRLLRARFGVPPPAVRPLWGPS